MFLSVNNGELANSGQNYCLKIAFLKPKLHIKITNNSNKRSKSESIVEYFINFHHAIQKNKTVRLTFGDTKEFRTVCICMRFVICVLHFISCPLLRTWHKPCSLPRTWLCRFSSVVTVVMSQLIVLWGICIHCSQQ